MLLNMNLAFYWMTICVDIVVKALY